MAPLYSKQLPPHPATYGIEQSRQSIRDNIESIWRMVDRSHRCLQETREAIARANKILAWQL